MKRLILSMCLGAFIAALGAITTVNTSSWEQKWQTALVYAFWGGLLGTFFARDRESVPTPSVPLFSWYEALRTCVLVFVGYLLLSFLFWRSSFAVLLLGIESLVLALIAGVISGFWRTVRRNARASARWSWQGHRLVLGICLAALAVPFALLFRSRLTFVVILTLNSFLAGALPPHLRLTLLASFLFALTIGSVANSIGFLVPMGIAFVEAWSAILPGALIFAANMGLTGLFLAVWSGTLPRPAIRRGSLRRMS